VRLGVVVPVLNEAAGIEACLTRVLAQPGDIEVVVVDGGSTDATMAIASRLARVVRSERGRGAQMNAGARLLRAEVLLFLHGDTLLPDGAVEAVRSRLTDGRIAGGTFCLRFDVDHPLLRLYAACTRLPLRLLHSGDQGIFVRREVFHALGGFRELPLMEDVDFLRRLRSAGRVAHLPVAVTTSARRFVDRGIVRQQLLNVALVAAYELGAAPERLARWYR
jgi:rSAM/selenodomain-associated transferase 2